MRALDATERTVYEKILAAHLWAARSRRLGADEFLRPLLDAEERKSEAYATYDLLQGRAPEFAPFLLRILGFTDEETALRDLGARYGEALEARLNWYRETGR